MEKQWVEDAEKSPQAMCGLLCLHPYLEKLDSEPDDSSFDPNTRQLLIRYVKQVRESRGYDVDTVIPMVFLQPFRLVYEVELRNKRFNARVMAGLNLAMEIINAESLKAVGKTYEFVEFKKIIETANSMFLYTFTARVHGTDVVKTLQAMVCVPESDAKPPFFGEWRVKLVPDVAKSS